MTEHASSEFHGPSPAGYQLGRMLGEGASAVVYLAHDVKHDRHVAIKLLHRALDVSPERFISEIRIVANLQHPNILPLHDSGVWNDQPFYVMPYVEGETLAHRLERERQLPLDDAVRIAIEVADALDYAHTRGVIHRDIKPANILLSSGHALVADFGIARAIDEAAPDHATHTGVALGTPAYMSPEQAGGTRELDGRSDIYSLGCVLFEMIAGVRPFTGPDKEVVLARRLIEDPPGVRRYRSTVSPDLEHVIQRAMATARADRFKTGKEFAAALSTASGLSLDRRLPASRARTWAVAATGLLAVSVLGWGLFKQTARATPALDQAAYATFPFRHGAGADSPWLDGDGCARLLHDAISRWQGVRAVNDMVANDIWVRQQPRTVRQVIDAAESLGARWVTWGEVIGVGDSIEIRASVYDVARGAEAGRQYTVRLPRTAPNVDSAFAVLADSILIGGRLTAEERAANVAETGGTRNVEALRAYLDGREAMSRFELGAAQDRFRDAVQRDATFGLAHLWLARATAWRGDVDPSMWREAASNATLAARLPPPDSAHAAALLDLAEGRMQQACDRYKRLIARDSMDFGAWFGLGDCNARDTVVVRDARSPSGWAFRGSYHTAIAAYRRALSLAPSFHLAERGAAFSRLSQRVFFTEESRLRLGAASRPDTLRFASFPSWSRDTLGFVPYPFADVVRTSGTPPPTERQAVSWAAGTHRQLMDDWVRAFPSSADALENDALAVEATSASPAELTPAIALARRALARAQSPEQKTRVRAMLVRLLLKSDSVAAARALADSTLSATSASTALQATYLAGLAALTGRARLSAALLANAALHDSAPPFITPQGVRAKLPGDIASSALQLQVYSALGAPADSIRSTFLRTDRRIMVAVRTSDRLAIRQLIFRRPLGLAYREVSPLVRFPVPPAQNLALAMQQAFAEGDTAAARRVSAEAREITSRLPPGTAGTDGMLAQAQVLLALGDTAQATRVLDEALGGIPRARGVVLRAVWLAASIPRVMILRANLALQTHDTVTFQRWARSAVLLWSDADPELRAQADTLRDALKRLH